MLIKLGEQGQEKVPQKNFYNSDCKSRFPALVSRPQKLKWIK